MLNGQNNSKTPYERGVDIIDLILTYSYVEPETCNDPRDESFNRRLWLKLGHMRPHWEPSANKMINQVPCGDAAYRVEKPHAAHPKRHEHARAPGNYQKGGEERPPQHAELVGVETFL